jgi:hypothetical protein
MLTVRQIFGSRAYRRAFVAGLAVILVATSVACSKEDKRPPVATPSFTASRDRVALGGPIDFTYQFDVAAPIKDDYRVLVHVVNPDGDTIWIDDHDPAIPTSQWKVGQKVQYTRQRFLPVVPFTGEATVRIGLYRADDRLPLQGQDPQQSTYKVGTLQLLPQSENVFIIYKSGWHPPEFTADNTREWQWTQKSAVVNFKNPRKDVTLYLETDGRPDIFNPAQQVTIVVGGKPVKTFAASSTSPVLQRISLTAAELGTDEMVEMRLDLDKAFVPAQMPSLNSQDVRELGIRVYHLFIEPK